ncbi:MAG TPA: O-antigen ligase family protein [Bacilli bacterium]
MQAKVPIIGSTKVSGRVQALLFNRFFWLTLLMLFPAIDYFLRNIMPLPLVSSLWDEGLLVVLMAICGWRIVETNRTLPPLKTPLLAFTLMGLAYFIFNLNYLAVNIEGFRAVFQYIIAFFIGYYILSETTQLRDVTRTFVIVAGLVGLYGVIQYILGVEVPAGWIDSAETVRTRSFSIVQSPNILGSYMVMVSPIALGLALTESGRKRWVWLLLFAIMLAALVFSGSRGAWLAFAAALGLVTMLLDRRIFIAFILVSVLAASFVPTVRSRITSLISADYLAKSSNDGRLNRYMNAYDKMRDNPFFGEGLGHYGGAVGERRFGTTYVDSYYFKTLAETGLLGLSLYLWLMASLLYGAYLIWRRQKGTKPYFLYGGIFAGLLAVIVHNAVENIFEMPFMNTFFWLLAGMMLSQPFLSKTLPEEAAPHE